MTRGKIPFDKKYLRYLLVKHRKFLKSLYEAKSAKAASELIQKADNFEVNTLIRVLCLQIQGGIPLLEEDAKKVGITHRKKLLEKFQKNSDTSDLVRKHLNVKKTFLTSIASTYSTLLKPLFVKDYTVQYE